MSPKWFLMIALCLGIFPGAGAQEETTKEEAVRLAVVITPESSGLIGYLAEDFLVKTGYRLEVTSSSDVFQLAHDGKADVVISHYGKDGLEKFVLDGYGTWPKMVFSNQAVIIGPPGDPAKIKGLQNAALAMKQIAEAKASFIVNSIAGMKYLEDILWQSAGNPAKGPWYHDPGIEKAEVVKLAEEEQGYFLWGAYPFLRYKDNHGAKLDIMVSSDPVLQRIMSAIIVNPNRIRSVNSEGAEVFLNYLLSPATQASIAAFRTPGIEEQLWWPAGRDN
ncbi:MAG: hypothetical protein P8Z37_18205 [Acidobacteriota bacterium]